jgi:hypothetical protein
MQVTDTNKKIHKTTLKFVFFFKAAVGVKEHVASTQFRLNIDVCWIMTCVVWHVVPEFCRNVPGDVPPANRMV